MCRHRIKTLLDNINVLVWVRSISPRNPTLEPLVKKMACQHISRMYCTFQGSDEAGTFSRRIPTCLHAGNSTRLVVPFTFIRFVIIVTENSCKRQNKYILVGVVQQL